LYKNIKGLDMVKIKTIAPNHVVVTDSIGATLFSYNSPICTREYDGSIILYTDWKYSKTTSKYRSQFLNGETTKETQRKLDDNVYELRRPYDKIK